MDCRILLRFVGIQEDLDALWSEFMELFPEAELPSVDSGEWYSVEDYMTDEFDWKQTRQFLERFDSQALSHRFNLLQKVYHND